MLNYNRRKKSKNDENDVENDENDYKYLNLNLINKIC